METGSTLSWLDIVTVIIALYGAVLSTINLIKDIRNNKSFIIVELSFGFLTGSIETDTKLFITAKNPSNKPVTVNGVGLILPNKKQLIIPYPEATVNFPHELQNGKSCIVWCSTSVIAKKLIAQGFKGDIKLKGFYKDELDRKYKSRISKANINTMLNN